MCALIENGMSLNSSFIFIVNLLSSFSSDIQWITIIFTSSFLSCQSTLDLMEIFKEEKNNMTFRKIYCIFSKQGTVPLEYFISTLLNIVQYALL